MVPGPELQTQRLVLRRWRDDDLDGFAAINADPVVMEYFASTLSREETANFIVRIEHQFHEHGYGLWALELASTRKLIGYTGLWIPGFDAPFTPAVEVGWRLARDSWGNGYATESAKAVLTFGFDHAGLDEIVSFTIPANKRSSAVMERLGMTHDPRDDFDHPLVEDQRLRRHVLYRISARRWAQLIRD
ncbi:MAG: GNAT family N-acetyltransferase [Acidimicrobiia bacterium]